jgi:hypothetical protein
MTGMSLALASKIFDQWNQAALREGPDCTDEKVQVKVIAEKLWSSSSGCPGRSRHPIKELHVVWIQESDMVFYKWQLFLVATSTGIIFILF